MTKSDDSKVRLLKLLKEQRARRACNDCLYWLTQCTRTKDEQDLANPFKPFPEREYFRRILQVLEHEPITFVKKSRTMMMSWLISGYCMHKMATRPATGVVIQSQDEDRAVHCIGNQKILWEQSDPELQERWKLARPIEKQPYNKFELANGSWSIGIPGDPNKMRSVHPSIIFFDEAAFMLRFSEAYNIAVATRCPRIICNSSAEVGAFEEMTTGARPVEWPDYEDERTPNETTDDSAVPV